MTRLAIMCTTCLGALILGCAEEPKAKVDGPSELKTKGEEPVKSVPKAKEVAEFDKWIQLLREGTEKRIHGVKLTATAEVKGEDVQITWTVDYTGPRPPLIMLKPRFPTATDDSTFVRVFVPTQGEKTSIVRIRPDTGRQSLKIYSKEMFITVDKGKTHSETLLLPIARLKSALEKEWPEFDKSNPPSRCYLQLHHSPRERGDHLQRKPGEEYDGLDAWTGDLSSSVMKIELSKW